MSVEIREHAPGSDNKEFVNFHHDLFRDDSAWVAPLNMEVRERLTPGQNPFFEHAEAALFTAHRDGVMVGRISAQVDHAHLEIHGDDAGFFGFFETVDDQSVADALLGAAEAWLVERGMKVMRGPYSLSINEEVGTLVEGFEHPPVMMMPHARAYQGALAEGYGLEKAKDVLAWSYDVTQEMPPRAKRAWQAMNDLPEFSFRSVDPSRMRDELDIILDIFNDAWRENYGFVPATEAEVRKMAQDMRLIIDSNFAFFAMVEGREVGMCVALPNMNEAARDLEGRLFPFGFLKLLWRLKVKRPRTARLMLLGIRSELRGQRRYMPMAMAIIAEVARRGQAHGMDWAELGWTLEDNRRINAAIRSVNGKVYKRYRIYEKAIGAEGSAG